MYKIYKLLDKIIKAKTTNNVLDRDRVVKLADYLVKDNKRLLKTINIKLNNNRG